MALLPHFDNRRAHAALLGIAVVAGVFGVIVALLRQDFFAAWFIGIVVLLLIIAFVWTGREPNDDER